MQLSAVKQAWDDTFAQHTWGRYPCEELIRWINRRYSQVTDRATVHILDLGCGAGSSTWFLCREGFEATGMDCSETAIRRAQQYLAQEGLSAHWVVSPMPQLPFANATFDAVIDIAGNSCNPWAQAVDTMAEVRRILKPKGGYFGLYLGQGSTVAGDIHPEDPGHYANMTEGPFQNVPFARLYTVPELETLMQGFDQVAIDGSLQTLFNRSQQVQRYFVSAQL
jgi:ubiquinone/menaquinone biosynthesis C-methylase UbiE